MRSDSAALLEPDERWICTKISRMKDLRQASISTRFQCPKTMAWREIMLHLKEYSPDTEFGFHRLLPQFTIKTEKNRWANNVTKKCRRKVRGAVKERPNSRWYEGEKMDNIYEDEGWSIEIEIRFCIQRVLLQVKHDFKYSTTPPPSTVLGNCPL